MQVTLKPVLIEKELIQSLTFKEKNSIEQHPNLAKQIEKGVRLGNTYRSKVSIYFRDDSGSKRVDTTIWAHGAKYICLKGGVWLPIDRLIEIKC
ncbi:MAG: hypothetical protein QNK23_08325 [Crocinitomicaceae bacterium]|nr:hypothetical protein [Crocinitomicaceae bacterium]